VTEVTVALIQTDLCHRLTEVKRSMRGCDAGWWIAGMVETHLKLSGHLFRNRPERGSRELAGERNGGKQEKAKRIRTSEQQRVGMRPVLIIEAEGQHLARTGND